MASRKRKRPFQLVSFREDSGTTDTTPSLSFSSQVIGIGSVLGSRRIQTVLSAKEDVPQAAICETPLEQLLGDLRLDPVEKAEQEAGISVKIKPKRYQTSVRWPSPFKFH